MKRRHGDGELPYWFFTNPGCDAPEHRRQIMTTMLALELGPVSSPVLMGCGCVLTINAR